LKDFVAFSSKFNRSLLIRFSISVAADFVGIIQQSDFFVFYGLSFNGCFA